jgi:NADPH:quinone reductase-like Zn-dependent oxidoreductase
VDCAKIGNEAITIQNGCGDVVAVGSSVTRFKKGDRVITSYYPRWIDGALSPSKTAVSFGVQLDGTLAQEAAESEEAFVLAPRRLDAIAAASLPCAGVTAWNALFVAGMVKPGSEAPAAYEYLEAGRHFGKVAINIRS